MNSDCSKYKRLAYSVIQAATTGDYEAINKVLKHYADYISKLSLRPLYDDCGNTHVLVDEELRHRLEIKLITGILNFNAA